MTLLLLWLLSSLACHSPADTASTAPACPAQGPLDDTLTLADVQALGTHNSYHVQTEPLFDPSFAYTQPSLVEQADLGVRSFELDVHRADDGTLEVFHIPTLDPGTTCATLETCLGQLRGWSDAHPCHTPFVVWLEPKDDIDEEAVGYTTLEGHMAEMDAPVRAAWPDRLFTPDDLRGGAPDLPTAVAGGWPLLADLRGSLLVALLDVDARRSEYLEPSPILEGRALFVKSADPTEPSAALFKINNAFDAPDEVRSRVAESFLVTSTADEATLDDATNQATLDATLAAGPHYLASDHVVLAEGHTYVATLEGGSPRCHPDRVAQECGPAELEP